MSFRPEGEIFYAGHNRMQVQTHAKDFSSYLVEMTTVFIILINNPTPLSNPPKANRY
jgi:hypothetical protein